MRMLFWGVDEVIRIQWVWSQTDLGFGPGSQFLIYIFEIAAQSFPACVFSSIKHVWEYSQIRTNLLKPDYL